MPLRKRQKTSPDGAGTGEKGELAGKKKKKRQRIVDFFRSRKKKGVDESAVSFSFTHSHSFFLNFPS